MSSYELAGVPLSVIVKQLQELIRDGYNPAMYLSQWAFGNAEARLIKL